MKFYVYMNLKEGVRPISLSRALAIAEFDLVAKAEDWIRRQQALTENDEYTYLIRWIRTRLSHHWEASSSSSRSEG